MNRAPSQPDLDTPSERTQVATEPRHGAPGRPSGTAATMKQATADSPRGAVVEDTPGLPLGGDTGLFAGRVIGDKYRLLRHLGSGGMGTVFSAEHVTLRKHVALKFLRSDAATRERAVRRFEREAQLLARLDHENIVNLLDIGRDPTALDYLVLEFIRGRTLRDELQDGRLPTERVVAIVSQVARGLTAAHEAGVIHRDLKPENVMLTQHADGRLLVKLLDFGVARLREKTDETLTLTGQALGTAGYMSPEQARGDSEIDSRSDVYALGVIAYEGLTGVRPHDGNSYNETLFRVLNHAHKPVRDLCPDLPVGVEDVIGRALAKQVRDRYASAWVFALALQEVLRGGGASEAGVVTLDSPTVEGTLDSIAVHARMGSTTGGGVDAASAGTRTSESIPGERAVPWRVALAAAALGLAVGAVAMGAARGPEAEASAEEESPPASVAADVPEEPIVSAAPPSEAPVNEPAAEAPAAAENPQGEELPAPATATPRSSHSSGQAARPAAPRRVERAKPASPKPQDAPPSLPRLGGDYADSPYASPRPPTSKGP